MFYWAGCTLAFNDSGWFDCAGVEAPALGVTDPFCGVPRLTVGDTVPEGGTGILRSSGLPGTILSGSLGMWIRFATLL